MTAEQFAPWPEPQHVRDLRAQVARVEALAEKWAEGAAIQADDRYCWPIAVLELRAALDGDQ